MPSMPSADGTAASRISLTGGGCRERPVQCLVDLDPQSEGRPLHGHQMMLDAEFDDFRVELLEGLAH